MTVVFKSLKMVLFVHWLMPGVRVGGERGDGELVFNGDRISV